MYWFHCGRCGALFQSEAGEPEGRLCPKCGFDPSPGMINAPAEPAAPVAAAPATPHRAKRTGRKRKNNHLMLKLIGGWSLLLAVIVFGARWLWPEEKQPKTVVSSTAAVQSMSGEDAMLLQDAMPKCAATFSAFLAAEGSEGRNQFVLSPISTASKMARFFSMNPELKIDPQTLEVTGKSVAHLPDGMAIETQWKTADDKRFDAVFREESGEWRLDWDHFARYSDYPWALFIAGTGPEEGEFRLLARERLAEERKDARTISLMLYAPRFGQPDETGFQSPEFLLPRDSHEGRLIGAAFELARAGKRVFGSHLPAMNPEGMIRLRLKVRRMETELGRKFEITGVPACHWHALDAPGVEPLPLAVEEEKPTEN
jgi:rubredoxin